MSEYEPGTVAVATVRGVKGVRVFRREDHHGIERWETAEVVLGWLGHADSDVTDIRPLVVLDLDSVPYNNSVSRSQAETTAAQIRVVADEFLPRCGEDHGHQAILRSLADQIEAQTRPPRIPEPGIGHFVNARKPDRTHANFVRVTERSWVELGNGGGWDWDDLIDPVEVEGGGE